MIIEIGSYRFPGFYESLFCNPDEFIDDEYELQRNLMEIVDDEKLEVCYEYEDFNKYKKCVSRVYLKYYVEKLIDCLPSFKEEEWFEFEIIDDEDNIEVISPKYYNYCTDSCYCLVETNTRTLDAIRTFGLMREEDVQEYLIKHFTSCDGLISFVSNDINEWKEMEIEEYIEKERYLIALLDMIIALNSYNNFNDIMISTYYDVDKYYYAEPIVYCKKESVNVIKENCSINLKIKTVE